MTCPYGKEDFKRRMEWYSKIVEEYGIPNDVYHYMTFDDATNEAQEFLWCDKVGGKVFWAGRCSDAIEKEVITCTYSKKKRRSKIERDLKHKNRLKYLADNVMMYPAPVRYIDEIRVGKGEYIKNPKPYYKRCYRGKGRKSASRYHKKMSNRRIRRYSGELHNGNMCHKLYDFWWELT